MFLACCACSGLCDGLITRSDESYCVCMCVYVCKCVCVSSCVSSFVCVFVCLVLSSCVSSFVCVCLVVCVCVCVAQQPQFGCCAKDTKKINIKLNHYTMAR